MVNTIKRQDWVSTPGESISAKLVAYSCIFYFTHRLWYTTCIVFFNPLQFMKFVQYSLATMAAFALAVTALTPVASAESSDLEANKAARTSVRSETKEKVGTMRTENKAEMEAKMTECKTKHEALKTSATSDGMVKLTDVEAVLTCIKEAHEGRMQNRTEVQEVRKEGRTELKGLRTEAKEMMKEKKAEVKSGRAERAQGRATRLMQKATPVEPTTTTDDSAM